VANYFWLPYYDEEWYTFLTLMAGVRDGALVLPFANGESAANFKLVNPDRNSKFDPKTVSNSAGAWSAMRNGDYLQIAAHGRKFSTTGVTWKVGSGTVTWTPQQMAFVLQGFLQGKSIHYELLACFGANNWGFSTSFGERLRDAMKELNMLGTLAALQGATNIGPGQGRQTGSGRFTTAVYLKVHGGTNRQGTKSQNAQVRWDLSPGA
jgi:hypothetical protein